MGVRFVRVFMFQFAPDRSFCVVLIRGCGTFGTSFRRCEPENSKLEIATVGARSKSDAANFLIIKCAGGHARKRNDTAESDFVQEHSI